MNKTHVFPKKFEPTNEQISIAQDLLIAMAMNLLMKQEFLKIETQILAEGEYHYSDEWIKICERREIPFDKLIKEPSRTCHMEGLDLLNTPEYEGTDCDRYYKEINRVTTSKGFLKAENSECIAENNVLKLERNFIESTKNIHGLNPEDVSWSLENWRKLVDLLLGLFTNLAKSKSDFEAKKIAYFKEFIK